MAAQSCEVSASILQPAMSHQQGIDRVLDANLDRAREGLRVVEEWCRFGLQRVELVRQLKDYRQRLGQVHDQRLKLARHTATDPAAGLGHPAQEQRSAPLQVVAANCARTQEALRVLEEFGRGYQPELAAVAAGIRYGLYDVETRLLASQQRRQQLCRTRLYLVTRPIPNLITVVKTCLEAGLRLVQYREKPGSGSAVEDRDDGDKLRTAEALRQLCDHYGALFIVNDRVDFALAVNADGVHLGQGDMAPVTARHLLGPERIIGRSTSRMEQLRQAVDDGCDYVGTGPVHATPTKPGRRSVGLNYVREAADWSPVPCFAIGGVDLNCAADVMAAGAHGLAVVRAVLDAHDPGAVTRQLLVRSGCLAADMSRSVQP